MNALRVWPTRSAGPVAHGRRAAAQPTAARRHQWRRVRRLAQQPAGTREFSSGGVEVSEAMAGSNSSCEPPSLPLLAPAVLHSTVADSVSFHTNMMLLGAVLGDWNGLNVISQLFSIPGDLHLKGAVFCVLLLRVLCNYGVNVARQGSAGTEIKAYNVQTIIPDLRRLPSWGVCVVAFGIGVGEETLFRGFLQSATIQGLAGALPEGVATAAGLLATSLLFGLGHAVTPTYFWLATGMGLLFGTEYLVYGLQTAATTHWLYDWAFFASLLYWWDQSSGDSAGS